MTFAPRVDITLLTITFTVSKSAVGFPQLTGYLILSPPTVNIFLFLFRFFFSHVTNYPPLCDLSKFILSYILFFDEENCFGALVATFHSLGKAANFISKQDSPYILVLWVFPKVTVFE